MSTLPCRTHIECNGFACNYCQHTFSDELTDKQYIDELREDYIHDGVVEAKHWSDLYMWELVQEAFERNQREHAFIASLKAIKSSKR